MLKDESPLIASGATGKAAVGRPAVGREAAGKAYKDEGYTCCCARESENGTELKRIEGAGTDCMLLGIAMGPSGLAPSMFLVLMLLNELIVLAVGGRAYEALSDGALGG